MKKRILSFTLVFCILFTLITSLPITAFAATSGTCGDNLTWILDEEGTLIISGTGHMKNYSWGTRPAYQDKVVSVIISDGVKSIGEYAFYECPNLKSVRIGNGVETINTFAFGYCDELTELTISGNVLTIKSDAIYSCKNLTNISIGDSVKNIEPSAISYCDNLININLSKNNPYYTSQDGILFNKNETTLVRYPSGREGTYSVPATVQNIGNLAFASSYKLTGINIPQSVSNIGDASFMSCKGLTTVYIPDSVTNIGVNAFRNCEALTDVRLPSTINNIANYAFGCCFSLEKIVIPNNIINIGNSAFNHCDNLTNITMHDGIKNIGERAFEDCGNLTNVYYSGSKEEWNKISIGNYNTELTNAKIHYNSSDIVIHEKHDITIEVRDASTNKLIPDSQISVFSSANNAKFHTLSNGKITLKDVSFPIYQMGVNAWGYDYHKSYKNIEYPENGKIVFAMTSKESQNVPAQGVTIFNKIDKLNVGETHQLEAWVSPLNATNKKVTWSSSNTSIVTVNSNGLITALKPGTAKITATTLDGSFSDVISINIPNKTLLTAFYDIAYSFKNQGKEIPLKIYQAVYGAESGIIEYNNDDSKGTGGVCSGMVSTSMMFYNGYRNYEDYGGKNIRMLNFTNEKVRNFIWYMYLANNEYFWDDVKKHAITHNFYEPGFIHDNSENVQNLVNCASKEILSIYVNGDESAHELLSFGVTHKEEYNGKECSKLWVYDCNYPELTSDNRFIAFYKNTDGTYSGEWEYVGRQYHSSQKESILSYVTYSTVLECANKSYAPQLMSLEDISKTAKITFIQKSNNLVMLNDVQQIFSVTNGLVENNNIENTTYFREYFSMNHSNKLVIPDDQYTVCGNNDEQIIRTTMYSSSDSITTTTTSNAEITFDVRDVATEGANADNYLNINNNFVAGDYSITYMPFASVYGYNYDTITISGITDNIVNTYEKEGNIYVSGVDRFDASVVVGNETIITAAENLNRDSVYCVKVETSDGIATIQVISEDTEITEKVLISEREKLSQPLYDVESGEYSEKQTLTLTPDNEMVCLYYTTDGSEPYEDISLLYTEPISINQSMTINVLATQYGCENSDVLTLDYTLPSITIPVSTLSEGEYTGIQQVELIADDGANIYYTIDGSNPVENGELYTCPIILLEDTTLKAYSEINGCVSDVCEYTYTISAAEECAIDDIMIAEELVKVNITTNENKNGVLIVACYNDNGALVDVNYCNIELTANILNSKLIDLNTTGATKVSAFLWENMNNLKPLCNKFSKNIE